MVFYKYIGYGVTDENGVAKLDHDTEGNPLTHSYTGTCAGEVDVVASLDNPVLEGSIVSETYELYDCLMKDIGTSANPTNIYANTTYLNRTSEYTQITDNGTDTTFIQTNMFSGDICIELDAYVNVADNNPVFAITDGGTVRNQLTQENLNLPDNTWIHYKIQIKDNNIVWSTDYNSQTKTGTLTTYNRFRFRKGVGETLNYKNLMFYPI